MARVRFLAEAPPPPRGNAENQLRELRDYLTRVLDEIEFLIQHIGQENLERSLRDEITGTAERASETARAETELEGRVDAAETALAGKQDTLTFDSAPTEDSTNPVTSGGVFTALDGKQDVLTFDTEPTEDSDNPVTSGGVFAALPTSSQAVNSSLDLTLESDTRYLVIVQRLSASLGVYSIVVRVNGTVEVMTVMETNSAWTLTASTNTLTIATSTNAVTCSVLRF